MARGEQGFESDADEEDSASRFPIAMIAVVLLALVLLAIGGYGVVEQRKSMEAEIRELQARLATAMTPEESEAAREAQRQLTEQSDALNAEVQALEAENAELAARIAAMEREVAEKEDAAAEAEAAAEAARRTAEAEAARAAAAKQAAAAKAEAPTSTENSAAPGGEWFVNFGSYARRDIAESWAKRVKASAGSVVVQTATAGGRTLYRVRVVGLANRDAAERVATSLEREFDLPRLWVGRS
jgi:cell division septation protein DedD